MGSWDNRFWASERSPPADGETVHGPQKRERIRPRVVVHERRPHHRLHAIDAGHAGVVVLRPDRERVAVPEPLRDVPVLVARQLEGERRVPADRGDLPRAVQRKAGDVQESAHPAVALEHELREARFVRLDRLHGPADPRGPLSPRSRRWGGGGEPSHARYPMEPRIAANIAWSRVPHSHFSGPWGGDGSTL